MPSSKKKKKIKPVGAPLQTGGSVISAHRIEEHKRSVQRTVQWKIYDPSLPLLPGSWKINAGIFLLLIIATVVLYSGDLHLGFFSVDDPGYVTDNPWIKKLSWENLQFILTKPYFINYSPLHILSYLLDYTIAGPNAFAFHLSSNIWAGLVAGFVFLVALALTGRRFLAITAAFLFVVHPAHVEAIAWISNRKDLIAATFALPSLLAYIRYRKGGTTALRWYILSLLFFVFALAGKLSIATFPAVFLALDLFVEKRPFSKTIIDKLPFLLITMGFALVVALAQLSTGNHPDPFVYMSALTENIWLLSGFGSYVIYRIPPQPASMGFEILAVIVLIAVFFLPLLLRRRMPVVMTLIYWILFGLIPAQILSFIHPVTDRYLFFPSVAFVILIAWGMVTAGERLGRKGLIAVYGMLLTLAFIWGLGTVNYLAEWRDPRSVWYSSVKKSTDVDVYYNLGVHYRTLSKHLDITPENMPLPLDQAKLFANAVWENDVRLPKLLSEWADGRRGGSVEKEFQSYLCELAWQNFEIAIHKKGTRPIPFFYFRRGMLLFDKGDLQGARKEFLAELDDASVSPVKGMREEITVSVFNNLGLIAFKEGNFREALKWFRTAEKEQVRLKGNWIPGISDNVKRMEETVALLPRGPGNKGKSGNPEIAYNLGLYYMKTADRLGTVQKEFLLPVEEAKMLANEVWKDNPQLPDLLLELSSGQRDGPLEKAFQLNVKQLAWEVFEKAVQSKGDKVMPNLFFNRGIILGQRGDLQGARKEFMTALDEASRESDSIIRQQVTVVSHNALGVTAFQEKKYKEALQWFQKALQEQNSFGGNWVPDLNPKIRQMEALSGSSK